MTIEWGKVTWYSKILAVLVFVGTFFVGFWLGVTFVQVEPVYVEVPQIIIRYRDLQPELLVSATRANHSIEDDHVDPPPITAFPVFPSIGTKLGDFTVVKIYADPAYPAYGYGIGYSGTTTVTGSIFYNDMLGESCFNVSDDDKQKIPSMEPKSSRSFCFTNTETLPHSLRDVSANGSIQTVAISDYYETHFAKEGSDRTELIKIYGE